ncbi:MAG: Rieske (2Fe-2S) protein [Acidobacteriaceae bacterium]|nr:Rieske (2Fe-2S) protein [Acidobacteriaceae bacterium]
MSEPKMIAENIVEVEEASSEFSIVRRAFLAGAAGVAGVFYAGLLGYPIYRYLNSSNETAMAEAAVKEVTLKDANKLAPGSALMFKFGAAPAVLIHHANGEWVSLTAVCTHLGCTVQYEPGADRIHCGCHGGVYNAYTGANVSGPPPKPLKLFKVAVNDTGVVVSRA